LLGLLAPAIFSEDKCGDIRLKAAKEGSMKIGARSQVRPTIVDIIKGSTRRRQSKTSRESRPIWS